MTHPKMEQKDRLREFFNEAINSARLLSDNINSIDYFSVIYEGVRDKKGFIILNCNACMFKYKYKDEDSIIIIFQIPSPSNPESKEDSRHISQKVMELLKISEDCFINLDYTDLKEVKEDKFHYLTVIKKLKNEILDI